MSVNACGSLSRRVKPKQRLEQRRFAGSVRSKQTDAPAGIGSREILQNGPSCEVEAQAVQLNECGHARYYGLTSQKVRCTSVRNSPPFEGGALRSPLDR